MTASAASRRHFLASVSALGISAPLLPGVLWAKMTEAGTTTITAAMLKSAATIAGLEFTDETLASMVLGVNQNLARIDLLHEQTQMANLACYPGLALPNGFAANGAPTSINFMARPFGEAALLALAKAYQDSTGFNLKHPPLG